MIRNIGDIAPRVLASEEDLDFGIRIIKQFRIGNIVFSFTDSIWNALWIMVFLVIIGIIVRVKVKHADPLKPSKGFLGIIEIAVDFVHTSVKDAMGIDSVGFTAFYGSMILYILFCNLAGFIPWFTPRVGGGITIGFMRPPTADLAITLGLALITFFMTQGFAIKAKGVKGWLKGLTQPIPLLLPLNIIGEVSHPIALAFRLMGNILSGTIILGIYYALLPYWAYALSPILHAYFDIFAGILQSYIFVLLSMIYVGGAMSDD